MEVSNVFVDNVYGIYVNTKHVLYMDQTQTVAAQNNNNKKFQWIEHVIIISSIVKGLRSNKKQCFEMKKTRGNVNSGVR
jgi:hypothetical protein